MKVLIRLVLSVAVVVILVFGLYQHLMRSGFFKIQSAQVLFEKKDSTHYFSREALLRVKKTADQYLGENLHEVHLSRLQAELKKEKWLQSFQITRRWPHQLEIKIRPHRVYFSILNNKGQILPVINSGEILDPLPAALAPHAPIARQPNFLVDRGLRVKAVELLRDIPLQGAFSRATVSEIEFEKKNGFTLTLNRDNITVRLGEKNVRTKSLQVSQVVHYLENRKFQARVIDANLSQKVLVRLRKGP